MVSRFSTGGGGREALSERASARVGTECALLARWGGVKRCGVGHDAMSVVRVRACVRIGGEAVPQARERGGVRGNTQRHTCAR